ncbi:MAG: SRPBCC family protein [Microthrixaceae bacterium]
MIEGSASTVINRPATEVFAAIADITRMGEWSPECVSGRWVAPATEAAVGARFSGDNEVRLGPISLKKWTTTSEVTECVPGKVFEFVAEGYTTWRYELTENAGVTTVTESYSHKVPEGTQKLLYVIGRRSTGLVKGVERTLARLKAALEA